MEEEDLDRELEKLRRKQKIERRNDDSDEVGPRKTGRLTPFDRRSRKFDWKAELEEEEEDEDGNNNDNPND